MIGMKLPKISIVILNWNGLEDTIECLESLKKITYPNYEVIVVDNGSEGNDAQVLKERFGDCIHLIQNDRNCGFAGGNNIGMRYAVDNSQPDYILLLNNDTVVDPVFLDELVNVAEGDSSIGIAGAKIYFYDEPTRLQFVWGKMNLWTGEAVQTPQIIAYRFGRKEIDKGQYDSAKAADWVTGCCFLIKRSVIESIGLLDEGYFCYGEEVDYCFSARKAGYKTVYVPEAKVWHKLARSANRVTGFTRYYTARNHFRFMKKHATRWQYYSFLICFFCFYLWLATAYNIVFHRNLISVTGYYRGVRDGLSNSEAGARFYRRY
jgi:GT2 family glycosyltransferase